MASKGSDHHKVCYHCGEDCDKEHVLFDEKDFCCQGCKTVYEILNQNDLCTYYDLDANPGISLKSKKLDDKYAYLDNEEIARLLLDFHAESKCRVTFYIPAIHCSSCIWLLENLYKLTDGINHSRVNFVKKEFSADFDPTIISLRKLVELLVTLGYEPLINLEKTEKGDADDKKEKSTAADRSLYIKIGVAGFAFGNIMLLSFPEYFGFEGLEGPVRRFMSFLNIFLSLPVVFYCASGYFKSAWAGIRQRFINIDVPVSLGIIVLFTRSIYEILSGAGPGYLDSLSGLLFFLLIGRWFQNFTYQGLSFERDYKSYFPLAIHVIKKGEKIVMPVNRLKKGNEIFVRNKEIIPADSVLLSDSANIDYSFVTGESTPVVRKKGDYIYAGGRQLGGGIHLSVSKPVLQSYLTQLWNNEAFAKEKEDRFTLLIDRVSKYFTLVVLAVALGGFLYWWRIDLTSALNAFTAVLIVACPCALTLSAPFTQGTAMRIFGRLGFYLKNAHVLERLLAVNHIVFDKTGTITYNQSGSISFDGADVAGADYESIKALARNSTHPLSAMLVEHLPASEHDAVIEAYEEVSGEGLSAVVNGNAYKLGNRNFVKASAEVAGDGDSSTEIFIAKNDRVLGKFNVGNKYRNGIRELVKVLESKYKLSVLTGDNKGEKSRLQHIFGENASLHFKQSPEQKLEYIKSLQMAGDRVMMIGDGLNDAGALQQSDVGISITEDTANFTPASDAIMTAGGLGRLSDFLKFAVTTHRILLASFALSFLYNVAGVAFAFSNQLSPLVAAILMPLSSITVVVFATGVTNLMASIKKLI